MSRPSDRLVILPLDVLRLTLLAAPDLETYAETAEAEHDALRARADARRSASTGRRLCGCVCHAAGRYRPGCECRKRPGVYHQDDADRDVGELEPRT